MGRGSGGGGGGGLNFLLPEQLFPVPTPFLMVSPLHFLFSVEKKMISFFLLVSLCLHLFLSVSLLSGEPVFLVFPPPASLHLIETNPTCDQMTTSLLGLLFHGQNKCSVIFFSVLDWTSTASKARIIWIIIQE